MFLTGNEFIRHLLSPPFIYESFSIPPEKPTAETRIAINAKSTSMRCQELGQRLSHEHIHRISGHILNGPDLGFDSLRYNCRVIGAYPFQSGGEVVQFRLCHDPCLYHGRGNFIECIFPVSLRLSRLIFRLVFAQLRLRVSNLLEHLKKVTAYPDI